VVDKIDSDWEMQITQTHVCKYKSMATVHVIAKNINTIFFVDVSLVNSTLHMYNFRKKFRHGHKKAA